MKVFGYKNLSLYNDNFLTWEYPEESVDLIVTSPPYNLDKPYETYDDGKLYEDYLRFTENWLGRAYCLSKVDGRLCLNIPLDTTKGGHRGVYVDTLALAFKIGWKYNTTIVWNEGHIPVRTAWGSYMSASAPYVMAPVEMIAVLYKQDWKKNSTGESDITKEEFIDWTDGVWEFNGERIEGHPAPFPLDLPTRCIKLYSYTTDTVLDPFVGSGTTLVACALTGRKGVGVEISEKYCELARERLEGSTPSPKRATKVADIYQAKID